MSEANTDEIEKCLQLARTAISNRDPAKALRHLERAKRMGADDPSLDAAIAAARTMDPSAPTACGGADRQAMDSSEEGVRRRNSSGPSAGTQAGTPGGRTSEEGETYTAEQAQGVQRILRTKDYYDILGCDRSAGEDEVKKAYKKLALRLHPDKNKAPGAEDAFKKLSKAAQCLTDAEKRSAYDRYGDEDEVEQQRRRHEHDFVSPEEFFAAFFGGGAMPGHDRRHPQQAPPRSPVLQLLPMLFLVIMLASHFVSPETRRFSLTRGDDYTLERTSASLGVRFYVARDFESSYPDGTRRLAEFEEQVEIYYVQNLHRECASQEREMQKKISVARNHPSLREQASEIAAARQHPKPACKQMERIKRKHPGVYRHAVRDEH